MSSLSNLHQEKDGNQLEKEPQREVRLKKTRGKAWYVNQTEMFLVAVFILDYIISCSLCHFSDDRELHVTGAASEVQSSISFSWSKPS